MEMFDQMKCLTIRRIGTGQNSTGTGFTPYKSSKYTTGLASHPSAETSFEFNWMIYKSITSTAGILSEVPIQSSELRPEYLSLVRDVEIIISNSATKSSLSRLEYVCRVVADSLMPGVVHLTVSFEDNFRRTGDGYLEILEMLGPLKSFSRLASLKVVRESERFHGQLCRSFFPSLTEPPAPSRTPLPFMRLPIELQDMVLAYSDAISETQTGVRLLPAFQGLDMHWSCCGRCSQRDPSFCWCTRNSRYSSTCICRPWESGLFTVNSDIGTRVRSLYYRLNTFLLWVDSATDLLCQLRAIPTSAITEIRNLRIIFLPMKLPIWPPQPLPLDGERALDFIKKNFVEDKVKIHIEVLKNAIFDGGQFACMERDLRKRKLEQFCELTTLHLDEHIAGYPWPAMSCRWKKGSEYL